ncbi:hypothetical protein AGMMS50255_8050 [Spirochaetia bacterium]|nr:hypothetical protein AGMMS50255_8050 [Spirochaetia bacterium]
MFDKLISVKIQSFKGQDGSLAQILITGSNNIMYLFDGILNNYEDINSFECSKFTICRMGDLEAMTLNETKKREKKNYEYSSERKLIVKDDDTDFLAMMYDWIAESEISSVLIK